MSMHERHSAILAELSELGLSSARDLHQQQLAAETPERKAMLASALHRVSRSIRQTLALEARLVRDARRADLEDRQLADKAAAAGKTRRRDQVKAAVERLIWMEHEKESDDADHLVECLGERLDEEVLHDDFDAEPLEVHIASLCAALGLPDPPPQGEVSAKPTEGVAAHAPQPPRPSTPSPPSAELPLTALRAGGASGDDDPLLSDDYWCASG